MRRWWRWIVVVAISAALLTGTSLAASSALPRPKSGKVVPGVSVAGVHLGDTRAQMVARWGRPTNCGAYAGEPGMQCTYESRNARVQVELAPSLGVPDSRITSILWAASRKSQAFAGWKTGKGIRVGSTFRAFSSAYPGWKRFDGIPSLDVLEPRAGASTRVLRAAFTTPLARMQAGAAGRISSLWIFTTGLDCDLHVAPASGGLRLNGACAGTLSYYYPLRIRPTTAGVSVTSAQAADARSTRCQVASGSAECTWSGNSRLWPIDVTLGLSSPASSIEVAVDKPSCRNCLPFRLVVGG